MQVVEGHAGLYSADDLQKTTVNSTVGALLKSTSSPRECAAVLELQVPGWFGGKWEVVCTFQLQQSRIFLQRLCEGCVRKRGCPTGAHHWQWCAVRKLKMAGPWVPDGLHGSVSGGVSMKQHAYNAELGRMVVVRTYDTGPGLVLWDLCEWMWVGAVVPVSVVSRKGDPPVLDNLRGSAEGSMMGKVLSLAVLHSRLSQWSE